MRIIQLEAENVMRLKAVNIRPNSPVVQITGANGEGKSAVLNSIFFALAGAANHAAKPIRTNATRADICLTLGDGEEVKLTVRRRFTEAGTNLTVESPDGAQFRKPQEMLDRLLGTLTFDPLAFARLSPKAQVEQLRGIVKVDVDLDALDAQIADAYTQRTGINRSIKSVQGAADVAAQDVEKGMDVEPIDVSALLDRMAGATEHNRAVMMERQRRDDMALSIQQAREHATAAREEAAQLLAKAERLERRVTAEQSELDALPAIDEPIAVAAIRAEIDSANATNTARAAQQRARERHQKTVDELTALTLESGNLTEVIETAQRTKADAIARAAMPILGLSFGEGELTYNGEPFAQASTAEQIRVATAIGMALNPKLRILCIRDGALLDEKSMALLEQMAEVNDFQVWAEVVGTDRKVGIEMVDGSVKAIDGEPVQDQSEEVAAS